MVYIQTETYLLFEVNSIESEEKKRATFIAVVGDKTYETLLGLLVHAEPSGVVFIDIMNQLDYYYSPKPNIIVDRNNESVPCTTKVSCKNMQF